MNFLKMTLNIKVQDIRKKMGDRKNTEKKFK